MRLQLSAVLSEDVIKPEGTFPETGQDTLD